MIERIINLARDNKKKGIDPFSECVISSIDSLNDYDKIKAIVEVIKKLELDPSSYILYGKLNSYFSWITNDKIKEIKKRFKS